MIPSFLGPDLDEGPLPALFYFALSEQESLNLDPYNQPALHLRSSDLRIFSFTLPDHGPDLNPVEAIGKWAERFAKGEDPLTPFFEKSARSIEKLIAQNLVVKERIALMGLSRGGFVAGHIATFLPFVSAYLAFAPLTKLSEAKEFASLKNREQIKRFDLEHLVPRLAHIPTRFYIGNRDLRVSTRNCFHLIDLLANESFNQGNRSPPIELIISPSIGQLGHGTPKEIFHAGAEWVAGKLAILL